MSQDRVVAGCVSVFMACLLIGSCAVMMPSNKPAAARQEMAAAEPVAASTDLTTAPQSYDSADGNVAKAEAIVKDQFFPDQVDRSGSAKYQKEWYMVKGAIREAGYPCAAVAYVQQTMEGTFKAVCKVAPHTNKYDAFTINPDEQTVVPYR